MVFSWNCQHWLSNFCDQFWFYLERLGAFRHRIPCGKPFQVIYNKFLFQSAKVKSVLIKYSTINMSLKWAAWRIATVAFLFLARIRFPGHISLAGTLRKRYGRDLVKEVRALENLNFQNRKALLDLDFSILCRNKNVIPKFLHFKVSNKELRKSNAYVIYQKCLVNQKTSNKQKAVKTA